MSRLALVVLVLLLAAGPAWGLRATSHLDALEATLADRAAALAGATDKTAKKQLRAAEKSLARIAVDTATLAEDLKLAKKLAGPVAKAYAADDEVMDLLTAAADAFENAVEAGADVLARARAPLTEAKLTKKADRLLRKAEKARNKARTQSKLKKRLSLLYKAQRSADKAADVLAQALGDPTPTRLVLSPKRTLEEGDGEPGGVLFMGEGHVLDANVQGPDDSERDLYENGDLIIPPGPFHEQVMASLGSSSASAVHDTEVVLDSAGGLERIELAGSGATVESGDDSSTVFNIFSVGFTVVDPVPYSFTASTDLPDGQSQQVYVQLTRLSTVVACAEEAADDVPRACAGASGSEIATGTLIPGEYGFHARMVLGDDASATFSATLSLGN